MLASDVLETSQRRWPRWALCGALVLTLHVAGAAWAIYAPQDEEINDEVAGAIVMELAPTTTTQRAEALDTAPGPQTEEALPTPPTTERVDELRPLDIPQFEQSPLAPEPEVALPIAKPVDEITPEEEELKEVQPENLQPHQTVVAQSMAPPPQLAAKEAPTITARQLGEVTKNSRAVLTYQKSIRLHVKKHQRYPNAARDRNEQGTAAVEFAIDRTGRLLTRKLIKSSGYARLDEEALATLDRCNPFPLPPDEQPGEVMNFSLKIQFKIE
jgi:protein TonB